MQFINISKKQRCYCKKNNLQSFHGARIRDPLCPHIRNHCCSSTIFIINRLFTTLLCLAVSCFDNRQYVNSPADLINALIKVKDRVNGVWQIIMIEEVEAFWLCVVFKRKKCQQSSWYVIISLWTSSNFLSNTTTIHSFWHFVVIGSPWYLTKISILKTTGVSVVYFYTWCNTYIFCIEIVIRKCL